MKNLIAYDGWTLKQIRLLTLLANPLDTRTEAEKAREVGVCPRTVCRWKKIPEFLDEIHNISLKYLKERLPEVNYGLFEKAKGGDVGAIKLIYEILGKYDPTLKVQGEIKMASFEVTKEMMDGLAESILRTKNRDNAGTGEERSVLPM